MMFRKLYWVTEEVANDGTSQVRGVYTSIPDLIRHGLQWSESDRTGFRLTLVKLDCEREPLGRWESPSFEGLEERLQDFVKTDEFSEEHCKTLASELNSFMAAKV